MGSFGDYKIPNGVRGLGAEAAMLTRYTLQKRDGLYTGGCVPFYSPKTWRKRKEWDSVCEEPPGVVLIICHDGGALSRYQGFEDHWAAIKVRLTIRNLHVEHITGWWSAVILAK